MKQDELTPQQRALAAEDAVFEQACDAARAADVPLPVRSRRPVRKSAAWPIVQQLLAVGDSMAVLQVMHGRCLTLRVEDATEEFLIWTQRAAKQVPPGILVGPGWDVVPQVEAPVAVPSKPKLIFHPAPTVVPQKRGAPLKEHEPQPAKGPSQQQKQPYVGGKR